MNSSDWVKEYADVRPAYEKLTKKTRELLEEIVKQSDIKVLFESRTKSIESFDDKITRPDKNYSAPLKELTDLAGVRLILYSLRDIKKIEEIIKAEFKVDEENSVNKSEKLEPDRFGYLSWHYIVQVSDSRQKLSEWADIKDLRAEVQVRTALQHAWASVEHFLAYKTSIDVPAALRRRLSRLSAIFELADEELDRLIEDRNLQTEQYETELQQGNFQIEINADSLRSYVLNSSEPKYWEQYLRDELHILVNENEDFSLQNDIQAAQLFGLSTINDIDNLLKNARGWGEKFFSLYFNDYMKRYDKSYDVPVTSKNGPVSYLITASNVEKLSNEIEKRPIIRGDAGLVVNYAREARNILE
jgi:ppGpp synthetase/RelA/SpoT-type nucleotidyltranferase